MFTECTIREIIEILGLKDLGEVVLSERGSKVLNGLTFKESTLSFFVPWEKDFYALTANPDASPVINFGIENEQQLSIRTKYGNVHFYNKYVDIDRFCDWDTHSKIYLFSEEYLLFYGGRREFL